MYNVLNIRKKERERERDDNYVNQFTEVSTVGELVLSEKYLRQILYSDHKTLIIL